MQDPRTERLIRYGGAFADDLIVRARGSWLETAGGSRVLDFTAGQICATVGHNHPRVMDAIRGSLESVVHLNSWMLSPPVLDLADALLDTVPAPLERAMFLSTGGESVEVAVRMAKLATGRFEVASLTRSWHGLTGGAAALTLAAGRRGYGPTLPGSFALPAPVRLPLPRARLRRRVRLHVPGGGLRPVRPGIGRARRPRWWSSPCSPPAA